MIQHPLKLMEKTVKKEKATKVVKEKKTQMKKSKFVLAWEKMKPYNGEYADMRAILK